MATTTLNLGFSPSKGLRFTHTTDTSADFGSVPVNTYFLNHADGLIYYKDAAGNIRTHFEGGHFLKYNAGAAPTKVTKPIVFVGTAVANASGVATFELTDDGTATGTALFTNIYSVNCTAELNSADIAVIPFATKKAITTGKTLTINVLESAAVGILGDQGLELDTNGATVSVTVIGD